MNISDDDTSTFCDSIPDSILVDDASLRGGDGEDDDLVVSSDSRASCFDLRGPAMPKSAASSNGTHLGLSRLSTDGLFSLQRPLEIDHSPLLFPATLQAQASSAPYGTLQNYASWIPSSSRALIRGATDPIFYPIFDDEYKDLSLQQILELVDDSEFKLELHDVAPVARLEQHQPGFGGVYTTPNSTETSAPPPPVAADPLPSSSLSSSAASPTQTDPELAASEAVASRSTVAPLASAEHRRRMNPTQWAENFEKLVQFKKRFGHAAVPHSYKEDPALGRWNKRQRYQYKKYVSGESSTLTASRIEALESIGFVWDSQGACWASRLKELLNFKSKFGHCNVPSRYTANQPLATWVKAQRRQFRLYVAGKNAHTTKERILELKSIGFEFDPRTVGSKGAIRSNQD